MAGSRLPGIGVTEYDNGHLLADENVAIPCAASGANQILLGVLTLVPALTVAAEAPEPDPAQEQDDDIE